ncbi:hypothetical protein E2C01_057311 [Portunus trituberculatus]|uniref:Uncharacterized protein n=1 Tax=Portunus trituberculatus TaxID=210409 RepID=A0A5B7H0P6_PORTR|nr:hypothetical protein [Portunus trituberculatus]
MLRRQDVTGENDTRSNSHPPRRNTKRKQRSEKPSRVDASLTLLCRQSLVCGGVAHNGSDTSLWSLQGEEARKGSGMRGRPGRGFTLAARRTILVTSHTD